MQEEQQGRGTTTELITWQQVLAVAEEDYIVAFGSNNEPPMMMSNQEEEEGDNTEADSENAEGQEEKAKENARTRTLSRPFPAGEYLHAALQSPLSPLDVVTTEDWNANGGLSLCCTSGRINEALLERHMGVKVIGHKWIILTVVARLYAQAMSASSTKLSDQSALLESAALASGNTMVDPQVNLLGPTLVQQQQQQQQQSAATSSQQHSRRVSAFDGTTASPLRSSGPSWEVTTSSIDQGVNNMSSGVDPPQSSIDYVTGVVPGAKHHHRKEAKSKADQEEAKTLRLCKEKMFESFETGIPQLHRESVATKKVFKSERTGGVKGEAPFTWIDVVGKWAHHDIHSASLDSERFLGSDNFLPSRNNIHGGSGDDLVRNRSWFSRSNNSSQVLHKSFGNRSFSGGSPKKQTFHPRTSMSGSVRRILLGLEGEYAISLPLSQILTEIATPTNDSASHALSEMVSKALRTNYLNSDDLEAAAAAAHKGSTPSQQSLGLFDKFGSEEWVDLGDGGFSPPQPKSDSDHGGEDSEAKSQRAQQQHQQRKKADEHLLVMSTSSPFLRKALKTTLPPAGSAQEARSQKASLALAEFLKTAPGSELIKNLTERWLIYLNLTKRLVITIRPSDSIPIARIRENWTSRFQHLSMLNFVWQIYSSAVINFRHALEETLSLMDEVESLMTPSFVEKQLLQGISGGRHTHGAGPMCPDSPDYVEPNVGLGSNRNIFAGGPTSSAAFRDRISRKPGSSPAASPSSRGGGRDGPPKGMSMEEWKIRQRYTVPTYWERFQLFCLLVWTGNRQGTVGQQQLHNFTVRLLHLIYRQVSVYHRTLQTVGNQEAILADIFRTTASTRRRHLRKKHTIATFSDVIRRMVEESTSSSSSDDDEELAEEELILGRSRIAMGEARALRLESVERLNHTKGQVEELMNLNMSMNSDYLNDLVSVLTVIQTVFTPLGFTVTMLGMNFTNEYRVLFDYWNGYFVTWGIMLAMVIGLLSWFYMYVKKR